MTLVDADHREEPGSFHDPEPPSPSPRFTSSQSTKIAILLFLATCASTFLAGTGLGEVTDETTLNDYLWYGFSYSVPIMLILLCHEMGHFLTARWHGVPASPPFFIPMPILGLFGTMGAVILQPHGRGDRRAIFDIAIMGPLAGLVVAIPVAWLGVQQAGLVEFDPSVGSITLQDPLLLKWMVQAKFGVLPPNHDVQLNPLLFAGWAGLFLTGFNLLPIGQFDGGHLLYCLLRKWAHPVSYLILGLGVLNLVLTQSPAYFLAIFLLLIIGVKHPPTQNDAVPIGWGRMVTGWLTLGLFFLCFTPSPITIHTPEPFADPADALQPVNGAAVSIDVAPSEAIFKS